MTKIDANVKPICNDRDLLGIEDDLKKESVDMAQPDGVEVFQPFADQCVCENRGQFQKMCAPKPQRHSLFTPKAKPEPADTNPPKEPKPTISPEEKTVQDIIKELPKLDASGLLTGPVEMEKKPDGTFSIKAPIASEQTLDVLSDVGEDGKPNMDEVYRSLGYDEKEIQAYVKDAMESLDLPNGWEVKVDGCSFKWKSPDDLYPAEGESIEAHLTIIPPDKEI